MSEYPNITAIGVGYDVPLVDLDLITALVGADEEFLPVLTPAKHRRGEKRIRANRTPDYSGYRSKTFTSGMMTLAQFQYLVDTYEGLVTVYSWLTTTTPVRYNAILSMGDEADYEPFLTVEWGWCLKDVVWSLSITNELTEPDP